MDYILKRRNLYYFNRRIPNEFREYDSRKWVRFSLKTDSLKEAARSARIQNELLERHWESLVNRGEKQVHKSYENTIQIAKLLGVNYVPSQELATYPIDAIVSRLKEAKERTKNEGEISALLGGSQPPALMLEDVMPKFFHYTKNQVWNKSEYQVRKWSNPRSLSMNGFIKCVGNRDVRHLTKDDILKYRDWWFRRIQADDANPKTANKIIIHLKTILETVNDNMKLGLDIDFLFKKVTFTNEIDNRRFPFETVYLLSTLLNEKNLMGLNAQARWALFAMAETGAGSSEQVGLLPQDIHLDCEIPHIIIQPRSKHALKTKYRKRVIPLIGFALDAFKACPNGFGHYRDQPENLSAVLGKFLKENNLFPSKKHTVYSLRHSFQDRLLAVNAPDRVQADLMGHKFNRPSYGEGSSLHQKVDWMRRIQLKKASCQMQVD